MVDYGTILKRIRQQRKKRKFVQKEVAGWLGVDRTSYTKKETNAAPITIEEFLVLCDRLGTSPTAILRDESSATGYADAVRDLMLAAPERDQQTIMQMVEWAIQGVKLGRHGAETKQIATKTGGDRGDN